MSKGEFTLLDVTVTDENTMLAKVRLNKEQEEIEVQYIKMKKFFPNIENDEIRMLADTLGEELKRKIYQFLDREFQTNVELRLIVMMFFGEGYYEN